jgi:hypothetical protein
VRGDTAKFTPPIDEVDLYGDAQFEPLMVVAITLGAAALIKLISDIWFEAKRPGGQIVDARTSPPTCRPAPFLERNTLVLITAEGSTVYEPSQKNEALAAIGAVFGGGGG